jgi:hypothetical protein
MLPTQRWLSVQKATPSFVTQEGAERSILDQPLPADLGKFQGRAKSSSPKRRATTPTGRGTAGGVSTPGPLTPRGTNTTPTRPIHEDLLARGALYQQRKEALQEKAIREELRKCRPVPKVSPMAQQIERTGKIVNRLYKLHNEKERMRYFKEEEEKMKDEKVLAEFFKPKLSRRGCRAQGKTMKTQQQLWNSKREEKLEALKAERIAAQLEDVRDTPDINPRSELLAQRRREKEGLAGYSHFEALIERDRLSQLAKWEKRQREWILDNPGNPRITEYAARLHRDSDVSERLYKESLELHQKKAELQRKAAEEELRKKELSSRVIDERDASDLLHRHENYYKSRDQKIEAIRELEKKMHTPTINPVSDALAAKLPQSTMERLSTPRRTHSQSNPSHSRSGTSHSPSPIHSNISHAAPVVTPSRYEYPAEVGKPPGASPAASASPPPGMTPSKVPIEAVRTYERMMAAEERRLARLDRVRQELAQEELEECTFHPTTGATPRGGAGSAQSTYERTMLWAKKRDEKLAQERQALAEAESPPFTPNINLSQSPYNLSPASSRGAMDQNPAGFEAYIHRQEEARQRQEEAARRFNTPQGWTPHRTVPEEFHLGSREDIHVPSLQRPIGPPSHMLPSRGEDEGGDAGGRSAGRGAGAGGGAANAGFSQAAVRSLANDVISAFHSSAGSTPTPSSAQQPSTPTQPQGRGAGPALTTALDLSQYRPTNQAPTYTYLEHLDDDEDY